MRRIVEESVVEVNEESEVAVGDRPRRRWRVWVVGGVAVLLVVVAAGGVAYSKARSAALEELGDAQAGAVAACASVPTVEPELLDAGRGLTDVSALEALVESVSPIMAAEVPTGLLALRAATADLNAKQKACADAASMIASAKVELEGVVAKELRAKFAAEVDAALKIHEAGFQLDSDVAGKIDPDPSAPGTELRLTLLGALGDLGRALPVGSVDGWSWKEIADHRTKLADAKVKAEAAMKAVSDAYAAWQAQQAQVASSSSGESSSGSWSGGGVSYSGAGPTVTSAPVAAPAPVPAPDPAPAPQPVTPPASGGSTGGDSFEWGDEWVPSQTCDTNGNCIDHW